MNETITLEAFAKLPSTLLNINMEKGSYNALLSRDLVNEIYYTNLKKDIFKYFNKLYVENKVKYEAFTNTFYLKLKNLSQILTYEETIYLTETFFSKKTEERISEKLDISKAKLQVIKKSCLVKFYLNIIIGE